MEITIEQLLEHSFVITIDEKRLQRFNQVFAAHDLFPMPKKFQGVANKKNTTIKNCYLSHRNAILKAKELGWPYVCIFEDDAYPREDIRNLLDFYLSDVPDKCVLLILGNYRLMEFSMFNNKFFNHVLAWGSHAYVLFQKGYDQYLNFLDSVKVADCFQRMDKRFINPNTFFIPKKNLFIQYSPQRGLSGISGYLWHCFGRRLTKEEIFQRGFHPIEEVLKTAKGT